MADNSNDANAGSSTAKNETQETNKKSAKKSSIIQIAPPDVIPTLTGEYGRYHCMLFTIICFCKMPVALNQMAIIFLAPKTRWGCPDVETCPCDNPKFDTSLFTRSIITRWNLICGRKWLASLNQTMFQLGTLIGSISFGAIADRIGRKKPLLFIITMQLVAGLVAPFMPTYATFTFFRFLIGVAIGGSMGVSFVLLMEYISIKQREVISAIYQAAFNLGNIMLPVFSYFFRDYVHFYIALTMVSSLCLCYFCLLPESARWYLAMKKTDKAIKTIEKVCRWNKRPTENVRPVLEAYQKDLERFKLKKGSIIDLFRTPNIRKNIIAISYNWFTCSYCFYGVSQYVGQLGGNVFLNVFISAILTTLGTLLSIPLMKFVGRKMIVIGSNAVCAVCLLILAFIPDSVFSVVCACIGQVSSFVVFVLVYLYSTELFPTVVRNAAVGFSSMMARVGSMIAPFVIDLRPFAGWLPPFCFAMVPLLGVFITMLLPETKGCVLMTTIEEGEAFGKKKK